MHILVVNDDGPPNDTCSPYVLPLVRALRRDKHQVTVVIPTTAQSWISKAHLVEKALTATRFQPDPFTEDEGVEWTVINGTPASCTQLGLFHLTSHRGPVDLVLSGPNWGRNVTTLYNLASGTVGGALEGAQCGKKAVAISFASKDSQPKEIIEAACRVSARLASYLVENWAAGVELYAVNVPMVSGIDTRKAMYTSSLPCYWTQSSLFQELKAEDTGIGKLAKGEVREFKWRPQLKDVERGISRAAVGTDGWAMLEGHVSVTPMMATFKAVDGLKGEVFRTT